MMNPSIPPPSPTTRVIAFTMPGNYAGRLSHLIHLKGWTPLWCPTVSVQPTPHTKSALRHYILPSPNPNAKTQSLEDVFAIAFTSRTGILTFLDTLNELELKSPPLARNGKEFIISALGKDSEILNDGFVEKICSNLEMIRVLVPQLATPSCMVEALGWGSERSGWIEGATGGSGFLRDLG